MSQSSFLQGLQECLTAWILHLIPVRLYMSMKKNFTKPTWICTCSLWQYWYTYRKKKKGVPTVLPCIWFSGFTATQNKVNERNNKDCNLGPCDLWSQDIQCKMLHTALLLSIVVILLNVFMLHLKISGFTTLFSPDK